MHLSIKANLEIRAAVVVCCVLGLCPFGAACGQLVEANAVGNGVSSNLSRPDVLTVPDRRDSGKADGLTTPDSRVGATAETAAPAGSRELAQQYVSEKLVLWQQRLKLSDWRINWAMARRADLKPDTVGQIHWDKPSKRASILVMDSCDYRMPFNAMLDDMELTIIHELVHLKLTSLPHSEASRGSEEQAVNGLSEALFALEHQK